MIRRKRASLRGGFAVSAAQDDDGPNGGDVVNNGK